MTTVLLLGCVAELPDNVHVDIDLVRRHTGFTRAKILRLLAAVSSLGVECTLRMDDKHERDIGGPAEMIVFDWEIRSSGEVGGNATPVAHRMVRLAVDGYCETHGLEALARRDFSQLASVTAREDTHDEQDALSA